MQRHKPTELDRIIARAVAIATPELPRLSWDDTCRAAEEIGVPREAMEQARSEIAPPQTDMTPKEAKRRRKEQERREMLFRSGVAGTVLLCAIAAGTFGIVNAAATGESDGRAICAAIGERWGIRTYYTQGPFEVPDYCQVAVGGRLVGLQEVRPDASGSLIPVPVRRVDSLWNWWKSSPEDMGLVGS